MKYKVVTFWTMIWGCLFAFLQIRYQYHFYYLEQSQLFLNTKAYMMDKLTQVGGVADGLSEFLVQFFIHPYVGATIVSTLLVGVGILTMKILKRVAPHSHLFIGFILPVLTLLYMHLDASYRVQGTISYLMMLILLYGYMIVSNFRYRLIIGIVFTPILFGFGGSIAVLFALMVFLYEWMQKTSGWYYTLIGITEVLLLGVLSVYGGWLGDFRFSLTPDLYYHPKLYPPNVIYYSWICLPMMLLIVCLLNKRSKSLKKSMKIVGYFLQWGIIGILFLWGTSKYGDLKTLKIKELDYYARTEQWDKTIEACRGKLTNYLYVCHLNMALANQGKLLDEMFHYNQMGLEGLIIPWNKQENVSCLLSDIYFTMGAIASSQEMAFEAYVSAMGEGNPRMLKRLIQTNLIFGAYPVAEKYMEVLGNTWGYSTWADSQRRFLYQDEEVSNDVLLGGRKQMLPLQNTLTVLKELPSELEQLLEHGGGNRATLQYLGAIYLLTKNVEGLKSVVEKFYGTDILPVLPIHFQEALIVLSEKDPGYWKRFNLSESVVARFSEYKKQVLANRTNSGVAGLLNRAYGNTYWFYYMFK